MKKIWSFLHYRIVWTTAALLLAMVAVPAILGLVLKVLGLIHGASLHTFLFDVGNNVTPGGAAGGAGAGAGGAGGPNGPTLPNLGFLWLTPPDGRTKVYSQPSTNSQILSNPPSGMRVVYNNVLDGPNGQPSWYHLASQAAGVGWVPASGVSTTEPVRVPAPHITIPIDPNQRIITSTGSETAGARG